MMIIAADQPLAAAIRMDGLVPREQQYMKTKQEKKNLGEC